MKRLENETIAGSVTTVNNVGQILENIMYGQYKNAYMLSLSNNYRGESAAACKNYITNVTINILNGFFNIISEMEITLSEVKQTFLSYESAEEGIVDTNTLTTVDANISDVYKTSFQSLAGEVDSVLQKASKYISLTDISESTVNSAYTSLENKVEEINDELIAADSQAKAKLEILLQHMTGLERMIDGVGQIIDAKQHIDYTGISELMVSDSYSKEGTAALSRRLEKDPFSYYADGGSGWEQQWAKGAYQDVYAYAGVSAWTGEYASKYDEGKYTGNAKGSFFRQIWGHRRQII